MTEPAIEVRKLWKRFGQVDAVAGVDLDVPPGAFLVLLGPSGCGKTTVLRLLAGLEEPTTGEIRIGGRTVASGVQGTMVPPAGRGAGLVFQSYALWPHMTVWGNIEWPLKVARWSPADRSARVREVLSLLSIEDLEGRYPSEISGGQQQRVAIARTLAPRPRVLLFDEPLSNLDAKLRVEMRAELLRIHRATGATSVYVTHDQIEALALATHVAVMREGRIEQVAPPADILATPATPFVATFVGTPPGNVVPAVVHEGRFWWHDVDLAPAGGVSEGERRWLLYRPEQISVCAEPGPRRVQVTLAEALPLVGRTVLTCWHGSSRITAVVDRVVRLDPGATLYLGLPDAPATTYADDGSQAGGA